MYIELFLLDNLLMDFLILRLAAALCARRCPLWRLFLFAALGAALAMFSLGSAALSGPAGKLMSAALLALALPNGKSLRAYIGGLLALLGAAFLIGGVALGLAAPDAGRGVYVAAFPLRAALLCAAAAVLLPNVLRRRDVRAAHCLHIVVDGQTFRPTARVDTGNALIEPLSGLPVIVAYLPALRERAQIPIPAATVQGATLLYALRPDALSVNGIPVSALLALSAQPLPYALLPPQLIA